MTDEYPTDEQLQAILDFRGTPREFIDYINSIWNYKGFWVRRGFDDYTGVMRCSISTWGWSGNEDIVAVVKQTMFWMLWWRESSRGGHYTFEIPTKAWWNTKLPDRFGFAHSSINGDESMTDHILTLATYNQKQTIVVPLTAKEVDLFGRITMAIEKQNGKIHLLVEEKKQ
jgi:hypothetical protein